MSEGYCACCLLCVAKMLDSEVKDWDCENLSEENRKALLSAFESSLFQPGEWDPSNRNTHTKVHVHHESHAVVEFLKMKKSEEKVAPEQKLQSHGT